MNTYLIIAITLLTSISFAKSPFEGISGKSLIMGHDDCSSTIILQEAIIATGVNILENPNKM